MQMMFVMLWSLISSVTAQARIATVFLPDSDPFPSWEGEVHGIDATATTYLIHCAGPSADQCAFRPNLTVTQGPTTLHYTDLLDPDEAYDTSDGNVYLTVDCTLPLNTKAMVTCPNMPGYTFTVAYPAMNPNLVVITKTTWYGGSPTATPVLPDPATGDRAGVVTAGVNGGGCDSAVFCGGLVGPGLVTSGSMSLTASTTMATTMTSNTTVTSSDVGSAYKGSSTTQNLPDTSDTSSTSIAMTSTTASTTAAPFTSASNTALTIPTPTTTMKVAINGGSAKILPFLSVGVVMTCLVAYSICCTM